MEVLTCNDATLEIERVNFGGGPPARSGWAAFGLMKGEIK